jgi:uracil-DNA glycosylase
MREDLAAWLEFYRELGIEDFYRRQPRPAATAPAPSSERRSAVSEPAARQPAKAPSTPIAAARQALPVVTPLAASPPAQSLSLFEAPPPPRPQAETLEEIANDLGDCQRCRLAKTRQHIVFGEGDPHARLVFVGEGPGADEDAQGRPFVGRAGQLLNRMIQFIGMKREEVYICNVVKCRPPGNRTPASDEIETCSPFLYRQLGVIKPRVVCCLGAPAVRTVLGLKESMSKLRGRFYEFGDTKAFITFHPAYILRNAREEKTLRQDFETIRDFLAAS